MAAEYRVQLDAFEGPLDLLLYLIRRAEVSITDIPIAAIAEQYMEHLRGIERIDIEIAGEFLVMAATLVEIKSRTLAPAPAGESSEPGTAAAGPEADPRTELVQQLLAYKRYRDAADELEQRRAAWEQRFAAGRAGIGEAAGARATLAETIAGFGDGEQSADASVGGAAFDGLDLDDLTLTDLVGAFQHILATVNFDRLAEHEVAADETPIELHAADLLDRLRRECPAPGAMPLAALFAGRRRAEMIGLFLAMLELIRRREIAVRQEEAGGPILIALHEADAAGSGAEGGGGGGGPIDDG